MIEPGNFGSTNILPQNHQGRFWGKICCHIDGIAIGSAIEALIEKGVLQRLTESGRPLELDSLAGEFRARTGYFHVAMRALADQGFVKITGDEKSLHAETTESGHEMLEFADLYKGSSEWITNSAKLASLFNGAKFAESVPGTISEILNSALPPLAQNLSSQMAGRIYLQTLGAATAVTVTGLYGCGLLEQICAAKNFNAEEISGGLFEAPDFISMLEALSRQGWAARENGKNWKVTDEGKLLAKVAPQYFYSVSYLPLAARTGALIFPTIGKLDAAGASASIDRILDIRFSGIVFDKTCKKKFLETALPIFNGKLEDQPECVVDMGCGDGTMLAELFKAIKISTLRGKNFDRFPLIMVGADLSGAALETARKRMSELNIPGFCVKGDIGNPDALAARLMEAGINPRNVLHISKSVIHDRSHIPFDDRLYHGSKSRFPMSAFAMPDGETVPYAEALRSLSVLLKKWRPWTVRHGMLAIEAHSVPSEIVAANAACNLWTSLHALHGFSNQYLVDAESFRRAAESAHFQVAYSHSFAEAAKGWPVLTLWHLA